MKPKPLLTAIACMAASYSFASGNALHIELTDGTTESFQLNRKPTLTFDSDRIYLSDDNSTVSYTRSGIHRICFVEDVSSIVDTEVINNRHLTFNGKVLSAVGEQISLYDTAGNLIKSATDKLSTADLRHGIYIAATLSETIKIMIY